MKQTILSILIVLLLLGYTPNSLAEAAGLTGSEPFAGDALCLPGVYAQNPADCQALGPSVLLTNLAKKGITMPLRPLPARSPSPELTKMSINYAKIDVEPPARAAVYSNLEDAVAGRNQQRYLPASPMLYISYIRKSYVNNKPYVQIASGEWIRGSPAAYSTFQGLLFDRTPPNSFGWIIDQTKPRVAPGYKSMETRITLYRNTQVQIFDVQTVDGTEWYQINLDQWVERRAIRQVMINIKPPEGVDNNRWIEVNLYEQTLSVYDHGQLVFATLIASGLKPFYTRPGLFKIQTKKATEKMTGSFEADRSDYYYLEDVPWTMYFDEARALHGAYWRAMFGYTQSHGCVNLSVGDARWLYDWANVGDWVYVWDPSGKTPTDPKYYTPGGA
ncbi:MAG TPA: L,D-transpeptidase [Anaerolineaceae bacterium]